LTISIFVDAFHIMGACCSVQIKVFSQNIYKAPPNDDLLRTIPISTQSAKHH